jgi:sigma-E factor negative regulatory protein RseB
MIACGLRGGRLLGAALLTVAASCAAPAWAQDAGAWLKRAATAARELNYVGTIVYQSGARVEVSRLTHFSDGAEEIGKLVSLDGPQREVIRTRDEITGYLPDRKLVRIEARTFRNVFPSIAPSQLATLTEHYAFRIGENARIAGVETQAVLFEPKDGLRYGHKFWAAIPSGLLIKARLLDERGETIEQFAFTDISIGVRIDREAVQPTFLARAPEWRIQNALPPEAQAVETGWTVNQLPPGFRKVVEGFRSMRGKREQVAHLVYSDGLVAVSVFVEPMAATHKQLGASQQGAIHVFSRQVDDHMVTVLGEAPGATIRQIAQSVSRR